jgi:hypothetical protein
MKNISDKLQKKIETHFMINVFFRKRPVCDITRKSSEQPDRPQMTKWFMHIACWIPKAKNINSEYVTPFCFSAATVVARTRLNVT